MLPKPRRLLPHGARAHDTAAKARGLPLHLASPVTERFRIACTSDCQFGGFAGGAWLEDAAFRTWARVVGREFAGRGAAGAIGQGFRAVHFVEVGVVDS